MKRIVATLVVALSATTAQGHDRWGNGEPVEPWVKAQCCGADDAHKIPASEISIMQDGYHISGLNTVVPMAKALPSPDGFYYGFWRNAAEPDPIIFCFFAPLNGT